MSTFLINRSIEENCGKIGASTSSVIDTLVVAEVAVVAAWNLFNGGPQSEQPFEKPGENGR